MNQLQELTGLISETHCFSGLDKASIAALAWRFKLLKVAGGAECICGPSRFSAVQHALLLSVD